MPTRTTGHAPLLRSISQIPRAPVHLLDRLLRRAYGVFAFTDDPGCIFRLRVTASTHAIELPGVTVQAGAPVVELHFWNERMPQIPASGPDMAWGKAMARHLSGSYRMIARYLQEREDLHAVQAVGATTVLVYSSQHSGPEALFRHMGFHDFPAHRGPLGRFGEWWDNAYTWALMWAYNEATLRQRTLLSLRRTEIWMSRKEFLDRYGGPGAGAAATDLRPAA